MIRILLCFVPRCRCHPDGQVSRRSWLWIAARPAPRAASHELSTIRYSTSNKKGRTIADPASPKIKPITSVLSVYFLSFLPIPTNPSSPRPKRSKVAGSGTGLYTTISCLNARTHAVAPGAQSFAYKFITATS